MLKKFYHATSMFNLCSIINKGLLNCNVEKVVYLTESPYDAYKFAYFHGTTNVLILEVELDEEDVIESFDHSQSFFKCRAWMYPNTIPIDRIYAGYRWHVDSVENDLVIEPLENLVRL